MFTENQLQILALLISQPDKEYYLTEIGFYIEKSPGVFQRGINSLEKQGVIRSQKRGNQRLFQINKDYQFFKEIKSIVQKTKGIEGLLKKMIDSLPAIKLAIIYGSYVQDKMRPDSDIDLLIVTTNLNIEDDLLEILPKIEKKVQREINYKIYSNREFGEKMKEGNEILTEILNNAYILLKGKI